MKNKYNNNIDKYINEYYTHHRVNNHYSSTNYNYKLKNNKKPYIVAITAFCLKDDHKKYINLGFDDYIAKPININNLKKCMNTFLNLLDEGEHNN